MSIDLGDKNALPSTDPMILFDYLYNEANKVCKAAYFTLSTIDPETNRPSSRTIELADRNRDGFHFFTRTHTKKVGHLNANPCVSMVFLWQNGSASATGFAPTMQVRVEGIVRPLDRQAAERDFANLPSDATRISIIANDQADQPIDSHLDPRKVKEEKRNAIKAKGPEALKCPEYHIGYEVIPDMIEFYQTTLVSVKLRFRRDLKGDKSGNWIMEYFM